MWMKFNWSATAQRAMLAQLSLALVLGTGARAEVPVASGNYVLVTQLRPEAPDKFFTRMHGVYDLCAAVASEHHVAAKPFPKLPPDFASVRTTYARDGQRSVLRIAQYRLDFVGGKPNAACEMRLFSQLDVTVTSQGMEQTTHVDDDGARHADAPVPSPAETVTAARMAQYTAAKTVHGVQLKCSAAGICVVDPALIIVAQGRRPVQAAALNNDVATYGTTMVLEPVSLTVGKPVDPALFATGNSK